MKTTAFVPGAPCWTDLSSPDIEASRAFYGGLFGWESQPGPPEAGGYTFFTLRGEPVAAVGPVMAEGDGPRWITYMATPDAEATAKAVQAAGGAVSVAPMAVFDQGGFAQFTDPHGAEFAVWQPGRFKGAGLLNEPGAFSWIELNTRDVEGSRTFYRDVFGWTGETHPFAGDSSYTEVEVEGGGGPFGGILLMNDAWPAEIPQHWMHYFAVEDTDTAAARAAELGGSVSVAPFDLPHVGRIAVLGDPHGAYFSVITRPAKED
ncbi:VOC family protein [Streptomyces sp. NPDC046977]|uniref:VOC family protein n=1 Tax=Streptomyces sp. NPDC046977 TaxID=3154703 RepID=UPI0033EC17DB